MAIDWNPRWSADGRYLYFASDRGGAMNIWRMPIDEASAFRGRARARHRRRHRARVTQPVPTTAKLVFRSAQIHAQSGGSLRSIPRQSASGRLRLILDDQVPWRPTSVSPDGKWLAFWNILEPQEDVFIVAPTAPVCDD